MAAGQSQRLYSSVGIFNFNWYCLSSPPQILLLPGVDLERKGLVKYYIMYSPQYNSGNYSTVLYCAVERRALELYCSARGGEAYNSEGEISVPHLIYSCMYV